MRRQKRAFLPRLAVTGAAVLLLGSGLTAGATEGYEPADKGRLIVVGEPDNMSSHVEYCRGETILDPATIPWVDGGVFGGKAARSAFQGSLDPLALVGGKGTGKRLVFHAIRNLQCLSYFCKRLSHSFPSFLGDDSFSMRRSISHTQNRQRMPSKYTRRMPQRMENETRKGPRRTPSKAPIR